MFLGCFMTRVIDLTELYYLMILFLFIGARCCQNVKASICKDKLERQRGIDRAFACVRPQHPSFTHSHHLSLSSAAATLHILISLYLYLLFLLGFLSAITASFLQFISSLHQHYPAFSLPLSTSSSSSDTSFTFRGGATDWELC